MTSSSNCKEETNPIAKMIKKKKIKKKKTVARINTIKFYYFIYDNPFPHNFITLSSIIGFPKAIAINTQQRNNTKKKKKSDKWLVWQEEKYKRHDSMKLVKNLKISTQDKLILTISPKAFVHIASTASACQTRVSQE